MNKTASSLFGGKSAAETSITHFNHAGAGVPDVATVMAMGQHLLDEVQFTPLEAAARAGMQVSNGYELAASLLGCSRDEVAFGSGHGQLYGDLVAAVQLSPGDRILVSPQEWVGNLIALKLLAKSHGAIIEVMPIDETTAVDVKAVARMMDERVRLVALTWVGASGALINPAAMLGDLLKEYQSIYLIDASQALGQLPVDVVAIGCDAMVACGRKYLRGPRGTAMAFVKSTLAEKLRPISVDDNSASWEGGRVRLHKGAQILESAEFSVALRLGLIEAMRATLNAAPLATREKLDRTASKLRTELANIPGVSIHDLGREMAAFVTFSVAGISCDEVKSRLFEKGITIGKNGVSYTPIDLGRRGIPHILRASVHLDTDAAAISRLVGAISIIAAGTAPAHSDKAN